MGFKFKVTEAPKIDAGVYPAKIYKIEEIANFPIFEKRVKTDKTEAGMKLFIKIKIDEPEGERVEELDRETNLNLGAKSFLGKVVRNLWGSVVPGTPFTEEVLKDDDAINYFFQQVVGKVTLAKIEHSEKGYPKIAELMAAPKMMQGETAAPKAAKTPPPAAPPVQAPAPAAGLAPDVSFDDDDIPF